MNRLSARARTALRVAGVAVAGLLGVYLFIKALRPKTAERTPRSASEVPAFAALPPGQAPFPPAPATTGGVDAPSGLATFLVLAHRAVEGRKEVEGKYVRFFYPALTLDCIATEPGWTASFVSEDRDLHPPGRVEVPLYLHPSIVGYCVFRRGDDQRILTVWHPPDLTIPMPNADLARHSLTARSESDGIHLAVDPPIRFLVDHERFPTARIPFEWLKADADIPLPHAHAASWSTWVTIRFLDANGKDKPTYGHLYLAHLGKPSGVRYPPVEASGILSELLPIPHRLTPQLEFFYGSAEGYTENSLRDCIEATKRRRGVPGVVAQDACMAAAPDCSPHRAAVCLSKACRDDYWSYRFAGGEGHFTGATSLACRRSDYGTLL